MGFALKLLTVLALLSILAILAGASGVNVFKLITTTVNLLAYTLKILFMLATGKITVGDLVNTTLINDIVKQMDWLTNLLDKVVNASVSHVTP